MGSPNPTLAILTSANAVTVPEGGTTNFQVKLNSAPNNSTTVTVSRVSGDTNLVVQSGASLVFDAYNWSANQTVTLLATADADQLNGVAIIRCSAPGLVSNEVTATEQDSTPTLTILTSANAVTVPEGGTTNFQVKLDSAPNNSTTVTVSRVSGDTNLVVQSGASLVFGASNWSANQTVTLLATTDADQLNGVAIIRCSAPGLVSNEVTATEQDNTPAPLVITTASLPNGITNGTYSQTLTASGGTLPYSWSLAGGFLPSGLTLITNGVITGTPTAVGTFSFTVQVSDVSSPVQTTNKPLSIAIVTVSTVATIWPTSAVPGRVDGDSDSAAVELGVKFRSDVTGSVVGIRFYKATANTGTHVGNLWTSNGMLLRAITFTNESASGWQQASFAATSSVAIASNTVYVVSYHATNGHYSCDTNYFLGKGMDSPPLHALASGVSGGNGVYAYGSSSLFPNQSWSNANYWVDVVFQAGSPPTLTSIAVTPANTSILAGTTQQFTATGTYSDGNTQNLSNRVTWTSLNTAVATINTNGLATGLSAGTATISATLGSVSGNATLTVRAPPTLTSIAVTPTNSSILAGATQQFTATGTYSDGGTQNLSNRVTWTSLNTAVATINTNGLATGLSAGTATISATLGSVNGNATLTVQTPPTLTSIAVTPTNSSILAGATQQFTATGTYSDGGTQNLSNRVTWTSLNTAVATINTNGLATGLSAGTATISATLGSVSGNATLTVQTPPTLTSIAVTPTNSSILAGATQQFTATGTYSDGSTQNLSNRVTWTSLNTAVATINTNGLATGLSAGTTTISATLGSVSGNATLTVQPTPLVITTASLPNGITNGTYSQTLTASGGTLPYSWSLAGGSLPSGLTLVTNGVITGMPTAVGTFSFTVQVSDVSSPVQTTNKPLSIAIVTVSTVVNHLADHAVPGRVDGDVRQCAVELGVKFRSDVAGTIVGIRFYKATANTGTHVGNLWTSNGALLRDDNFRQRDRLGVAAGVFAATSSVAIASNTVYVARITPPTDITAADLNYFLGKRDGQSAAARAGQWRIGRQWGLRLRVEQPLSQSELV